MGNSGKVLGIEFGVSVAVSSWAAMKAGYWPWPPTIVKTSIAFAILSVVSIASEELAAMLGAGFILANLVRIYSNKDPYTGGIPQDFQYKLMQINEQPANTSHPSNAPSAPSRPSTGTPQPPLQQA